MRLVDILIATLVLLPAVAEGVPLPLPGAQAIEVSDLGVPLLAAAVILLCVRNWRRFAALAAGVAVLFALWRFWPFREIDFGLVLWKVSRDSGGVLVAALTAVVARGAYGEPWERSFFVRWGMRAGRAWRAAVDRSPLTTLWTAAGAMGGVLFGVALLRHRAFQTHGFDLGIFTNALWNAVHGNGYISSVKGGINLLADHQSPVFLLLAPLFVLLPRPETLLFAQAFGLAAGGPALYYLARMRFGREHWAPAALPWLYWSYLPLRNANAFDFHPEVFMLPLFLWAFAGFAGERRWQKASGVLALLAALAAKESAPVVAVGIGIAWALLGAGASRARWPGIALAAAGVAVFFFDVKIVPQFFGAQYAYLGLYERFGGGIGDLLLAPFVQPAYFFSQLLDRERLNFLFWTLAPLGFLPLCDWRGAIAALPPYVMLLLSEGDQRVRIIFHYGIEPGTALFWALPLGLAAFARRFGWKHAGLWILFWAAVCFGPGEFSRWRTYFPAPQAPWLASEVLPCLDPALAMAASDSLVPQLATRAWIGYPDQLVQQPSGQPVSCVVTDLRLGTNWPLGRNGVGAIVERLPSQGYREAWRCGEVSVYERPGAGCLRCTPSCPSPGAAEGH